MARKKELTQEEKEFYDGFKPMLEWNAHVAVIMPSHQWELKVIKVSFKHEESVESAVCKAYPKALACKVIKWETIKNLAQDSD